jgi:ribonuclease HII
MNLTYEQSYFDKGYLAVGGVDEVGRGCLAGPVTAACAIITPDFKITPALEAVNDSKKLSPKKRTLLAAALKESLPAWGLGWRSSEVIDRINILQAALEAMGEAVNNCLLKPGIVIIDGNTKIKNLDCEQATLINGDALAFSVAAASIIAKVARDELMAKLAQEYPEYFFEINKGYGTAKHLDQLDKCGPCPIHRRSFAPLR